MSPIISIVLSFYNEENVLCELINRLRLVMDKMVNFGDICDYELIFINDSSSDNSEKIILTEMLKGNIVLVNMSRNFGVSECAIAGFECARGDAIIYMDSDLQDPPELIPDLIKLWLSDDDAEVVYTTRKTRENEHWLKLKITKFGYFLLNKISDIDLKRDSGDFKLLSKRAVSEILKLKENKPYLRGLVDWIGFKQIKLEYDRAGRFDGRSNTKMRVLSQKVLYYWLDRALISFSDAPLKIVLVLGIITSIVSLAYIVVVIAQKILGFSVPGWAALMSAILFIGGIQLLTLGIVGLYIGAMYQESKRRPRYIVKDIIRNVT